MDRGRNVKLLVQIYRRVNMALEWLALSLVVIMTLVTMYRVTMRYFLNFTPSWTEELSCILMIWLAMLGLAIGVRERMHLAITLFYDWFPSWLRKTVDSLLLILQTCLGLYLTLSGVRLTIDQFPTTMSAVKILPFSERMMPNSIMYIFVPVAGLLILLYTAIHIFDKNGRFTLRTLVTENNGYGRPMRRQWK